MSPDAIDLPDDTAEPDRPGLPGVFDDFDDITSLPRTFEHNPRNALDGQADAGDLVAEDAAAEDAAGNPATSIIERPFTPDLPALDLGGSGSGIGDLGLGLGLGSGLDGGLSDTDTEPAHDEPEPVEDPFDDGLDG